MQHCVLLIPDQDVPFNILMIRSEFAVNKLKKWGSEGGTFLLRQSPKTFGEFFLTVCVQVVSSFNYKFNATVQRNRMFLKDLVLEKY